MSPNSLYTLTALCLTAPLAISFFANRFIRSAALRRGFVDQPGGRKRHGSAVPLGGGIGIVLAVATPILAIAGANWLTLYHVDILLPANIAKHQPGLAAETWRGLAILGGMVAMLVLGLIDDRNGLGALTKFLIQVIAALWAAWFCEIRLLTVLGPIPSIAISACWIVLITNAFNLLDNMDGLSAGVAAIVAVILAFSAFRAGQLFVPLTSVLLAGALLGFLVYNFTPASLYMGDAGSLSIGYLLAILTVRTTYYHPELHTKPAGVLVPLIVLAVPLYDVLSVVWIRWRAGESVFRADRRHFSHRLVQRGMQPRTAVLTIYLATAATGFGAIFLPRADWPIALAILAQTLCILLIVALLERQSSHVNR